MSANESRWSGPETERARTIAAYVADPKNAHVAPAELARRIRRDNLAQFVSTPRKNIEAHIIAARLTLATILSRKGTPE